MEWITILFAACVTKQTQGNIAPHMQVRLSLEPVLRALSKSSQRKRVLCDLWDTLTALFCAREGGREAGTVVAAALRHGCEPVSVIGWERMVENTHPGLSWRTVPAPPCRLWHFWWEGSCARTHCERICNARMGMGNFVLCKYQWYQC